MTQPYSPDQGPLAYATPIYPNPDLEHLRLLAMFHWIVGPIQCLFGCIPIIHLIMGIAMLNGGFGPQGAANQPDMRWMGWIFVVIGGLAVVIGWTMGLLTIYSGFLLKNHRGRIFSIIVSAINCIHFPFGTTLGIFTLIVLLRRSVEDLYRSTARI